MMRSIQAAALLACGYVLLGAGGAAAQGDAARLHLVFDRPKPDTKQHFKIDGDEFVILRDKTVQGGKGKWRWEGDKLHYTTLPLELGQTYACPAARSIKVDGRWVMTTPIITIKARRGEIPVRP